MYDRDMTFFWCLGILFVTLMAGLVWAVIHDANEWERFRVAHACKKVGHMRGDLFNTVGIGANGQVAIGIGATSDKTGWSCDDGMTYWR